MQMQTSSDTERRAPKKKKKPDNSGNDKQIDKKIEELKKKVAEGFYEGTDILDKIAKKLLKDI